MIDLDAPVPLTTTGVRAWHDLDDPARVWACADGPRWAVGADGTPDVHLLLHRRGDGPAQGGSLTATVDLALTASERDAVVAEVAVLRAAVPGGTDEPPPVPPACLPPDWAGGEVTLELAPGLTATATPSGTGENRATVVVTLDPTTAATAAQAWADGLPGAHAVAQLRVRSAVRGVAGATSTTTAPGLRLERSVGVAVGHAVELPLTLEAPLRVPHAVRRSHLTDIAL